MNGSFTSGTTLLSSVQVANSTFYRQSLNCTFFFFAAPPHFSFLQCELRDPQTSPLIILPQKMAIKKELGHSCVSMAEAQEDTMQCNTPPPPSCPLEPFVTFTPSLFPLPPVSLSQSFHLYFLARDSKFPSTASESPTPPPPAPSPVSNTCRPSRQHRSAEPGSGCPFLILLTSLFPLQPSVKPTKVT